MTAGSIQNRVLGGSILAVAITLGATGFAVHQTTEVRLRKSGEDVLRSVLDLGADRVAAESVFAMRRGADTLDGLDEALSEDYLWVCRRAPQAEELARSKGFPDVAIATGDVSDPSLEPGDRSDVLFRETPDGSGAAWRVASVVFEPTDRERRGGRRPGPPPRDGGRGDRTRRGPGGGSGGGPGGRAPDDGPQRGQDQPPFRPGEQFVVFLAVPIAEEVESLSQLARLLAVAGLGAMIVAALSIRAVVRRGLAPLGVLSSRVASISETDLDDVIEVDGAPAELQPIIESFDATRARLAEAFTRERRFTSDAAHELRTPLAGLRATLEVVLRRERSTQEHRVAAGQCLEIALAMQETVEALLLLARSGVESAERAPVELESALRRAFAPYAEPLERRNVTVDYSFARNGATVATVVPALLDRVLTNLTSNAASYATSGSIIEVAADVAGDRTDLSVSNACDPLPEDTAERAFEPFWRADLARTEQGHAGQGHAGQSRAGSGRHTGLGLALVRTCLDAMDGDVSLETTNDTFTITVSLPL